MARCFSAAKKIAGPASALETDLFLRTFDIDDVFLSNVDIEQLTGPDQITELLIPVVHRGERAVIGNILANLAEMRPAIVIGCLFHRSSKRSYQNGVTPNPDFS